jgi:hypothetical protein
MLRYLLLAASLMLLLGCTDVECGEGTHQSGLECIANIAYKCGPGTVFVLGQCLPDFDAVSANDSDTDEDRDGED